MTDGVLELERRDRRWVPAGGGPPPSPLSALLPGIADAFARVDNWGQDVFGRLPRHEVRVTFQPGSLQGLEGECYAKDTFEPDRMTINPSSGWSARIALHERLHLCLAELTAVDAWARPIPERWVFECVVRALEWELARFSVDPKLGPTPALWQASKLRRDTLEPAHIGWAHPQGIDPYRVTDVVEGVIGRHVLAELRRVSRSTPTPTVTAWRIFSQAASQGAALNTDGELSPIFGLAQLAEPRANASAFGSFERLALVAAGLALDDPGRRRRSLDLAVENPRVTLGAPATTTPAPAPTLHLDPSGSMLHKVGTKVKPSQMLGMVGGQVKVPQRSLDYALAGRSDALTGWARLLFHLLNHEKVWLQQQTLRPPPNGALRVLTGGPPPPGWREAVAWVGARFDDLGPRWKPWAPRMDDETSPNYRRVELSLGGTPGGVDLHDPRPGQPLVLLVLPQTLRVLGRPRDPVDGESLAPIRALAARHRIAAAAFPGALDPTVLLQHHPGWRPNDPRYRELAWLPMENGAPTPHTYDEQVQDRRPWPALAILLSVLRPGIVEALPSPPAA